MQQLLQMKSHKDTDQESECIHFFKKLGKNVENVHAMVGEKK